MNWFDMLILIWVDRNWIDVLILIGVLLLLITTGMIVNYKWKTPIIRWWKKYRVFKFNIVA